MAILNNQSGYFRMDMGMYIVGMMDDGHCGPHEMGRSHHPKMLRLEQLIWIELTKLNVLKRKQSTNAVTIWLFYIANWKIHYKLRF